MQNENLGSTRSSIVATANAVLFCACLIASELEPTLLAGIFPVDIKPIILAASVFGLAVLNWSSFANFRSLGLAEWVYLAVVFSAIPMAIARFGTDDEAVKSVVHALACGVIAFALLSPSGDRPPALRVLIVGLSAICVSSIVLFLVSPEASFKQFSINEATRFCGILGHPNSMGKAACLLAIISACTAIQTKIVRLRIVNAVAFVILVGMAVATDSKQAVASLAVAIGVAYLIDRYDLGVLASVLLVIGGLFVLFALILGTKLNLRLDSFYGLNALGRQRGVEEIFSLTGRIDIWTSAIPILQDAVFFGNGLRSWGQYSSSYGPLPVDNLHSGYLEAWLSFGLIGGLYYILFPVIRFATSTTRCSALKFMQTSLFLFVLLTAIVDRGISGGITIMYIAFLIIAFLPFDGSHTEEANS